MCGFFVSIVMVLSVLKRPIILKKKFGLLSALLAAIATITIWTSFLNNETYRTISAVGGMIAGAGWAMMVLVWGERLSCLGEEMVEFSVPLSFTLAFLIYIVLLVFKGWFSMIADALLPAVSMLFAFRPAIDNTTVPDEADRKPNTLLCEFGHSFARIATLCLLMGMLWFQFSYFRLLSTPNIANDRFLHYLIPFTISSVLSVYVFVFCIKRSRHLDFTLTFRLGLPFILFSYIILYFDFGSSLLHIFAYTVNFIGMFSVQLSFWVATPKYISRSGMSSYILFGGLAAGEALGIFLGTRYGLFVIDNVTQNNIMQVSLVFFAVLLSFVMIVGFNPNWSFFCVGHCTAFPIDDAFNGKKKKEIKDLPSENITLLFERQAEELRRDFNLSSRETEIAALLLAGRSRPYIRDELIISLNTVHSHVSNIYTKCGVHSQQEFMDLMKNKAL